MLRLLRTMLPLLALASLLLGGAATARERHSCEGMTATASMQDCHKSDGGHASQAADDCAALFCAQMQAAPAPLEVESSLPRPLVCASFAPPSDADLAGLTAPPDLRPPIA